MNEYFASKSLFDVLPIIKDSEKVEALREHLNRLLTGGELEELKILTVVLRNQQSLVDPNLEALKVKRKGVFGRLLSRG